MCCIACGVKLYKNALRVLMMLQHVAMTLQQTHCVAERATEQRTAGDLQRWGQLQQKSRVESYLNSGKVWTNCPSRVGYCSWREKTGASVVSPLGLQNPLVVQSVNGQGIPSSRTKAKML